MNKVDDFQKMIYFKTVDKELIQNLSNIKSKVKKLKIRTFLNVFFIAIGTILEVFFLYLTQKDLFIYYLITFVTTFLLLGKVKNYPLTSNNALPVSLVIGCYILLLLFFNISRIHFNSIYFIINVSMTSVWFSFWIYLKKRWSTLKLGYFNIKSTKGFDSSDKFEFINMNSTDIIINELNGIIYDDSLSDKKSIAYNIHRVGANYIPILNISDIIEKSAGRVYLNQLEKIDLKDFTISGIYSGFKRLIDVTICLLTLPMSLFAMLIVALLVKIDSSGPVLFIQNRTGKNNKVFRMYKFRSMKTDSEKNGAQFASQNDSRITKLGRFLRKYRLDELPQIFNVIKGDMSLIGPRPEQKFFTDKFNECIPFYSYRHTVRPGISGWAQVTQGYATTVEQTEEKIEYDLYYIKNYSFWLDLLICLKTLKTILTGFGSR